MFLSKPSSQTPNMSLQKFTKYLYFLLFTKTAFSSSTQNLDLKIPPDVASQAQQDDYFCQVHPPLKEDTYVTEIAALPDVTSKYIHHMILQAVEEVAFHRSYKALGNVPQDNPPVPTYGDTFRCKHQPPVARGADEVTYYAWARDAGPLILPRNSGFKIPRGWSILLEVHFLMTPPVETLQPGLNLKTQFSIPSEIVGTYLLVAAGFNIPPFTGNYPVDMNAKVSKDVTIFACRVHAHTWSKVSTAYKIPKENPDSTEMIIQGSPHWAQEFYTRVPGPISLKAGDRIFARCVFQNNLDITIQVGSDGKDEMCNFYFLYKEPAKSFQQIPLVVQRDQQLGVKVPMSSFTFPKFPGYSGQSVRLPPKKPEFIADMGMAIIKSGKTVLDADQFVRGVDLQNVAGVALDSRSQYLYVFHRAGRAWDQKTFVDKKGERVWNGGDVLKESTILVVDISLFGRGN